MVQLERQHLAAMGKAAADLTWLHDPPPLSDSAKTSSLLVPGIVCWVSIISDSLCSLSLFWVTTIKTCWHVGLFFSSLEGKGKGRGRVRDWGGRAGQRGGIISLREMLLKMPKWTSKEDKLVTVEMKILWGLSFLCYFCDAAVLWPCLCISWQNLIH